MNGELSFLGQGWAFPPQFDKGNRPTRMVNDEEDIRQSLIILLSTRIGERIFRKDYGSGLHPFQFEELNLTQETLLANSLKKAILFFEPRILLNAIRFNRQQEREGILLIELDYTIRMSNSQANLVYPFYLDGSK